MQDNYPYDLNLLYEATDNGLRYWHEVFPDSVGKENKSKHFKTHNENTPSTTLSNKKSKEGIYTIYNHSSKESFTIIDHVMKERSFVFIEACEYLFEKYGLSKSNTFSFKPETTFEDTTEEVGTWNINFKEEVSAYKSLFPFAEKKLLETYNFKSVESYSKVFLSSKTERATKLQVVANENYPLFAYDESEEFKKIYEPRAVKSEKYSLKHHFLGTKPARHIYGWDYIFDQVNFDYIEVLFEELKNATSKSEKQKIKRKIEHEQLDSVFIATGGTDGINIASLGYYVIWFNSEAEIISSDEYYQLSRIAKNIYYVPDLDETGVKQAVKMCMQFIQIKIVWLPEILKTENKKDFSDWIRKLKNEPIEKVKNIFEKMLSQALNFQFWDYTDTSVKLNPKKLLHFLKYKNIRLYKMPYRTSDTGKEDDGYFIKIENNLISKVFPSDIKRICLDWLDENYHHINVYNMVLRSPFLNQNSLKALPFFEYKKNHCGVDFQYYFFNNKAVKVTPEKIETEDFSTKLAVNIWEEDKINHLFDKEEPFFEVTKDELQRNRIKVLNHNSNFFNVLINTSRVYWKKDADAVGIDTNNFNINSEKLNDDENYLQELHLLNKMFCIGHLLHQYKIQSKAWGVIGVDYVSGTSVRGSYGGTAKSFIQKAVFSLLNSWSIGGKTLKDDGFPMDGVTPKTRFVLFDDLMPYQDMEHFYNMITDNFVANQKGGVKYNIPFDDSPKVGFTTNFAPEMKPSTKRRTIVYYNSDYYHEATEENGYDFTRKISDHFNGKDILVKDYPAKNWNYDYNFMLQCLQFYLQQTEKIEAPIDTLVNKNAMMRIGDSYVNFFKELFDDPCNLNDWIEKSIIVSMAKEDLGNKFISAQKFTENLTLYVKAHVDSGWSLEFKKRKNQNQNSVMHFFISTDGKKEVATEETETKTIETDLFSSGQEKEPDTDVDF